MQTQKAEERKQAQATMMKRVQLQQEKRRKKALLFKESDASGGQESIAKINKNFKAL